MDAFPDKFKSQWSDHNLSQIWEESSVKNTQHGHQLKVESLDLHMKVNFAGYMIFWLQFSATTNRIF